MKTFEILTQIKNLSEDGFWHNVLPYGKFYYKGSKGVEVINIDDQFADRLINNFKEGKTYYKPFMNLDHNGENYGDIENIEKREDGIYTYVKPTNKGQELIKDKMYRYFSAEFFDNYMDKKTGKAIEGPVLRAQALTNTPAHPGVPMITLSEKPIEEDSDMDELKKLQEQLESNTKLLSEKEETIKTLTEAKETAEKKLSELTTELEAIKTENEEFKAKLFAEKKASWKKSWTEKGVPPAVVDELDPIVLSEKDFATFDKILEKVPKVKLNEKMGSDNEKPLDDEKRYETLGKEIADSVNPKKKE